VTGSLDSADREEAEAQDHGCGWEGGGGCVVVSLPTDFVVAGAEAGSKLVKKAGDLACEYALEKRAFIAF